LAKSCRRTSIGEASEALRQRPPGGPRVRCPHPDVREGAAPCALPAVGAGAYRSRESPCDVADGVLGDGRTGAITETTARFRRRHCAPQPLSMISSQVPSRSATLWQTTGGAVRYGAASRVGKLPGYAALQSQHVYFGNERDRLGTSRRERKQDRGRSLVLWQHAMKDHWLINDMTAPKMADRDDQRDAAVAVAKRTLARIRPSAAVASFGMCPEPELIKADELIQWACHDDRDLPSGKECGQPPCRRAIQVRGERGTPERNL
jgi:hypothetical protein